MYPLHQPMHPRVGLESGVLGECQHFVDCGQLLPQIARGCVERRRPWMRPRPSPLRPPRSPLQRFDLPDRGPRSCPSCCHRRMPRPQPKRPVHLRRRLTAVRFFDAPSGYVRKQRSRKAGAAADRRRLVSPALSYAPVAERYGCSRSSPYAASRCHRTSSGASSGSPAIGMASTLRSGNASPRRRKSAFRRRTITGSRSFAEELSPDEMLSLKDFRPRVRSRCAAIA